MLDDGTMEYPFTQSQQEFNTHSVGIDVDNQLIQKWVGMVDRCLEQQWKDSQQLLGCAKALKNSSNHSQWNLDMIVKKLSYLELGIIQRFIDLRQELVNHAYPIELLGNNDDDLPSSSSHKKSSSHADSGGGVRNSPTRVKLGGSSSFYMSLPSSPESDVYEPLLSKVNTLKKANPSHNYDNHDENDSDTITSNIITSDDKRCSGSIAGDSPFTLHSKLWQHHRLQQKQSDSSISSSSSNASFILASSPKQLRSLLAPSSSAPVIHDISRQGELCDTKKMNRCSPNFAPACTYNYYPSFNNQQQAIDGEGEMELQQQQCQQCYFCRSSMPKQKSLSLNEPARSVDRSSRYSSASVSSSSSFGFSRQQQQQQQQDLPAASATQQDDEDVHAYQLPSPPPPIPIPIRTSSSLDTAAATPFMISTTTKSAPAPKTTTSVPVLGTNALASHITPSIPSSSSSMVHTMSTRFHFKRNNERSKNKPSTTATATAGGEAFSHHCTASVIPNSGSNSTDHGKSSSRFVRSLLMHRKVSFPTLFSSNNKKVHPATTPLFSNNDNGRSMGSSFLL